jgi:GNAT superfamily N-acetyltransferase
MSITDIIIDVIIRPADQADQVHIQGICGQALDLEPDARDLPVILQASQQRISVVAEASGEIIGACYGSVGRQPRGHVDLLAVAPAAAGRGVGRRLLAAAEDQLRQRGVTEFVLAGNPPAYLWPGVDVRYTAMTCLAERAGYERFLEAVDMAVDLDAVDLDLQAGEEALTVAASWSGALPGPKRAASSTGSGPARGGSRPGQTQRPWPSPTIGRDVTSPAAVMSTSGSPVTGAPARGGSGRWARCRRNSGTGSERCCSSGA